MTKTKKEISNINIMKSLRDATISRNNKEIKIKMYKKYNHLWIKYNKELRPLIGNDYIMVESDMKQKLFTIMKKEELLNWISETDYRKTHDKGLFEFINPNTKIKPYFDIDKILDKKPTDAEEKVFLETIKGIIKKKIPNSKLSIDNTPTREKGDKWKISYHIIIHNLYFKNLSELCNSGFKDWVRELEGYGFDKCVYSKWREMKLPYQSKRNSEAIQYPEEDRPTRDMLQNHIIGYLKGDEEHINLDLFKKNIPNTIIDVVKQKKKNKSLNQFVKKVEGTLSTKFDLKFMTSKEILKHLPLYPYSHRTYWFILSWFVKYEGGSFNSWWDWAIQNWERKRKYNRDKDAHYIKWRKTAKEIKNNKNRGIIPTRKYIKNLLERIYGIKIKSKSVEDFFNTFITNGDVKVGQDKYMDSSEIKAQNKKCIFFNVSMGIGKTYSTMQYLNENRSEFKRVLWICNRISLGRNIYGDINKHNTEQPFAFYKDVEGDLGERWITMNNEHKYARLGKVDRLIIEVESLRHINPLNYDCVVADECESLFLSFMTDATHGQTGENYWDNYNNFEMVLKNTKKILLMDAYLSSRSIDFIKNCGCNSSVILYNKQPKDKTYREYLDFYKMLDDIAINIYRNKKVYMFYPYKTSKGSLFSKSIEEVKNLIKQMIEKKNMIKKGVIKIQRKFRKQSTKIIRLYQLNSMIYHGDINDSDKRALENVNNLWSKKNFILTNSCISVGVSYNNDNSIFDKIYLCYADFILPRDVIQTSFRIRKTSDSEIGFCYLKGVDMVARDADHGKKLEGIRKVKVFNHPTLTPLLENMEIEFNARGIECMERFMEITGYKKTFCDKTILNKESVKQLVAQMKEINDYKDIWNYEDIGDITLREAKQNSIKINRQNATTEEKLTTNLFYMKRFFKEDKLPNDICKDNFYKEIWDKYLKAYEMVNKFMNKYEILNTVFVKECLPETEEDEYKKYKIVMRDYKTLTSEEIKMIRNQIQLDKRYKYNARSLQQKVIDSFVGKDKKDKILNFLGLYNQYGRKIWIKKKKVIEYDDDEDYVLEIEE